MIAQEHQETQQTLETINDQLQDLLIRGLRSADGETIASLKSIHEEFTRIGAMYIAGNLERLIQAIENDAKNVAQAFLSTQTSLRLFERILTLQCVETLLSNVIDTEGEEV